MNAAIIDQIPPDPGWTQMTGATSKNTLAVFGTGYVAVSFTALDPTNIGLSSLSTQVATLTAALMAVSARLKSHEDALLAARIIAP